MKAKQTKIKTKNFSQLGKQTNKQRARLIKRSEKTSLKLNYQLPESLTI
jgi:hypothetical protein